MPTFRNDKDIKNLAILSQKNNTSLAITLSNGNTCLYNPIVKSEETCATFKLISHIVSPNHYHNKCFVSFHESFPKAALCSSSTAKKRLSQITGLNFKLLTSLKKYLPTGIKLYEPAGLKTGEVWLRFEYGKSIGWAVGDAFCGNKTEAKETKVPQILSTFPSYGIADKQIYVDWVLDRIEEDKPTMIIPCHGNIIRNISLSGKLVAILKKL